MTELIFEKDSIVISGKKIKYRLNHIQKESSKGDDSKNLNRFYVLIIIFSLLF